MSAAAGERMKSRLGSLDRSFLHLETETTQQVIACFCPLDREPDPALLRSRFARILTEHPRLTQRLDRRFYPRWVAAPDFSLDDHLFWKFFPSAYSLSALRDAAAELFSERWDLGRPLWRFSLLTARSPEASPTDSHAVALLFAMHHCLADGLGGLALLTELCEATELPAGPRAPTHRAAHLKLRTSRWRRFAALPMATAKLLSEWMSRPACSPLSGANSSQRTFHTTELPFAELRQIADTTSCSVNDVVLAVVSGAVRRYHEHYNVPVNHLRAIMPVSLRALNYSMALGNRLTAIGLRLPLTPADPLRRLQAIRHYVERMKRSGAVLAYALGGKVNAHLPRKLQRKVAEFHARRTHFICTNMPGPKCPLKLAGAQLLGKFGLAALMRGHGSAFSFISYAGNMCVSIVTDPAIIALPQQLLQYLRESFDELAERSAQDSSSTFDSRL